MNGPKFKKLFKTKLKKLLSYISIKLTYDITIYIYNFGS